MTAPATEAAQESFLEPSNANRGNPPLTDRQIQEWRNKGFVLVDGVVSLDLVNHLLADAAEMFPKIGSKEAAAIKDFGEGITFPGESEHFNY